MSYTQLPQPVPILPPGTTAARNQPRLRWREIPFVHAFVRTGIGGAFDIGSLPQGQYTLCVQVPGGGFLDPCRWSRPIVVKLATGQSQTGVRIILARGSIVQIRVNDPLKLLPANEKGFASRLITGVHTASGQFHSASLIARDAAGADLQVTVPFGTPLRFWAHTRHVRLTDALGTVLDNLGAKTPFQVPLGLNRRSFTLNVVGAVSP